MLLYQPDHFTESLFCTCKTNRCGHFSQMKRSRALLLLLFFPKVCWLLCFPAFFQRYVPMYTSKKPSASSKFGTELGLLQLFWSLSLFKLGFISSSARQFSFVFLMNIPNNSHSDLANSNPHAFSLLTTPCQKPEFDGSAVRSWIVCITLNHKLPNHIFI